MKRFKHGLVVGKFCPLHKGHEFLIHQALSECEHLHILSYSSPEFEYCTPEKRSNWLKSIFPEADVMVLGAELTSASLASLQIPDNAAADIEHRRFCAEVYLLWVNKPLDVVFSSESYGPGFVEELNRFFEANTDLPAQVEHRMIDLERQNVPISGTELRLNPHTNQEFLSPQVYASFVTRVCFLGAESTGKSSITQELARQFNTQVAKEYGRDLWIEREGKLSFSDMPLIAKTHVTNEEKLAADSFRYLFIDTSPLTTWLYSIYYFGDADPELSVLADRSYDLVFLCSPDFPFVPDGTRIGEEFRAQQHAVYLAELEKRNIRYLLLSGSLEQRITQVITALYSFENY